MSDTVIYTWVIGQYDPRTERGKSVLNHIGHGYHLINRDRAKNDPVIAAFKYVGYTIPAEYVEATPEQQEKLEKLDKPWLRDPEKPKYQSKTQGKLDVSSIFPGVGGKNE